MKHYESFQEVSRRYVQAMGGKRDVSVSFGGTEAYAGKGRDGRHVLNIPALPPGTVMTPFQVDVFNGYADHEAAHLRYTDFELLKLDFGKDPLGSHLMNLVEDIRIENLQIDNYPGSLPYLNALARFVDEESAKKKGTAPSTQAERLLELLYKELYTKYRSIDTGVIQGQLADYPEFESIAKYLEVEMPRLRTCHDTKRIAEGIRQRIPRNVDFGALTRPKEEDLDKVMPLILLMMGGGGGQPGKQADSQKALIVAAGGSDSHEERKEVLGQLFDQIKQMNGLLEGDTANSNKGGGGKGSNQKPRGMILPPVTTDYDRVFVPSNQNLRAYQEHRDSCNAEILAAKKMLNIFLRSRKKASWERGLEEGQLDPELLHALVTVKDTKVMRERRETPAVNTVVELLADCSGSMDVEPLAQSVILLAEAFNGIPWLKFEVVGFTTGRSLGRVPGTGRAVALEMPIFKDYREPYTKAKGKIGAIQSGGSTPLGDAYGLALERLITRKEPRKILWVISDGDSCIITSDHRHSDYELLRRNFNKSRRLGVETIGTYVGGQGGSLKHYVSRYSQVQTMRQMPAALLDIVRGVMA